VRLWVDADACPQAIREILLRAAERCGIEIVFVAQREPRGSRRPLVRTVRVAAGFDMTDRHIAREVAAGDLVVTADIPLAAEVVRRGAVALDPRGELYDESNIGECLAMRNLMHGLRSTGEIEGGGPRALSTADRRRFASTLDAWLSRHAGRE
jgi:hypothetical protein